MLLSLWILAGLLLLVAVGGPPVQRTQEARVLETAREMLDGPLRGWLIPSLNGNLRLKKPPLAYWMAAGAYVIGGVSEAVGRVPTVMVGWLTLGVTYAAARWLFDRRTAFFSAGCLFASYMFFRHVRLAETDAPAMLGVTLSSYALWRGAGIGSEEQPNRRDAAPADEGVLRAFANAAGPGPRSVIWFHLAAAAAAFALLSKGPPAFCPLLFLLGLTVIERRWKLPLRFVLSGAPLTFLILGLPWFAYAIFAESGGQIGREINTIAVGENHPASFLLYFPQLFQATAPWCLLMPAALFEAVRRSSDPRLRGLLTWAGSIFLPLCLIGNKQFHYLLPLMPPLMMLIGWWIGRVIDAPDPGARALLLATFGLLLLAAPAALLVARSIGGKVRMPDVVFAITIATLSMIVILLYFRRGAAPALVVSIASAAVTLALFLGVWWPALNPSNPRTIARAVRENFGNGPFCFYGNSYSLPLCFNLRTAIPVALTAEDLQARVRANSGLVVIRQTKSEKRPVEIPRGFINQGNPIRAEGQTFEFYRRDDAPSQ